MNTKQFGLAICIPTYNREKSLSRLLSSIVTQEAFSDDVSIVINDGPSKDGTEQMVREYQKKYGNIFYSRNEVAVGMLPAILESIEMSNGEYTWLFWSDDFMSKDALRIMKWLIKRESPKLVLTNRIIFWEQSECTDTVLATDSTEQVFNGFSDFSTYIGLNEPEKFDDKDNYFTFMSVFCFDTQYYMEAYRFTEKNVCSLDELKKHYFNYVVVLFSQLFAGRKIGVVESPALVFCQPDNHNWRPNNKISKDLYMLFSYLKRTYPVSRDWSRMLDKIAFRWWKVCNVFWPARHLLGKLWIYDVAASLWRKYVLKKTTP